MKEIKELQRPILDVLSVGVLRLLQEFEASKLPSYILPMAALDQPSVAMTDSISSRRG